MSVVTMTRSVILEPEYLSKDIMNERLMEKLLETTRDECSEKNGYIVEVIQINGVLDNWILPATSNIECKVQFTARTIKPVRDTVFQGPVGVIFQGGILVRIEDRLEILIPVRQLDGYKFEDENKQKRFINQAEGHAIYMGDTVSVRVIASKYQNRQFICFGSLDDHLSRNN
jgi:DNA-directed RNA polymerase subunit E'/Rpb7